MVSEQQFVPISGGGEDNRAVATFQLDLSSGVDVIDIGFNNMPIDSVAGIYVANECNKTVHCEVSGAKQSFDFPADSQSYYPVISRTPVRLQFLAPANNGKPVTVILTNFNLPQILGGVA